MTNLTTSSIINLAMEQSTELDERRKARYALKTNEEKEQAFLESVRGLDTHNIEAHFEVTGYDWKRNKDGVPVLAGKPGKVARLQFEELALQFTWYDDKDKPVTRTMHYGPNSTGCLFSLIINTIVNNSGVEDPDQLSKIRRSLWNMTQYSLESPKTEDSDVIMATAEDLVQTFNELGEHETLTLTTFCAPGTHDVVKSRFEFSF